MDRQPYPAIDKVASLLPGLTIALLLLGVVCVSAYWQLGNLSQPILEEHAFRQTQTALTVFYLLKNGFSLAYWTPVVGEGWSIPFEFPIYQEIVAIAVKLFDTPITNTGRAVSCAFTMACAFPIYLALREASVDIRARLFCVALFLSAPLYIFWGGTFMIESTALFFTLCFGVFGVKLVCRPVQELKAGDFAGLAVFFGLALLQKVTTALPLAAVISAFVAFRGFLGGEDRGFRMLYLVRTCAAMVVPVVIAYLWIVYTDQIKLNNPIGLKLTSAALREWNFGTWQQRWSSELWTGVFRNRMFRWNLAGWVGALTLAAGIMLAKRGKTRAMILALLAIGLLHMAWFTNLHIVHNYYQSANLVYFIMALGISALVVCDRLVGRWAVLSCLLLGFFVLSNLNSFRIADMRDRFRVIDPSTNKVLRVAEYVRANTSAEDVVIWFGFEWSSEAAFYAERKSLTAPHWDDIDTDVIENIGRYLSQPPAAIVLCPTPNKEILREAIQKRFRPGRQAVVGDCEVSFLSTDVKK